MCLTGNLTDIVFKRERLRVDVENYFISIFTNFRYTLLLLLF